MDHWLLRWHEKEVGALQSLLAKREVSASEYACDPYSYGMPTRLVAIPFAERTNMPDGDRAFVRIVLPLPIPEVLSVRDATLWALRLLIAAGLANEQLSRLESERRSRREAGASEPLDGGTTPDREA